jgi:hypothetical protein
MRNSFAACCVIRAGFRTGVVSFGQFVFESVKTLCTVRFELWWDAFVLLMAGAKKTIRPVAHHYMRLVTDVDPSTIPDAPPVKEEVIVVDEPSPQDTTTKPWIEEQQWCKLPSIKLTTGRFNSKTHQTQRNDRQQREQY